MRFQPDDWGDALWRPFRMAAADGGVYVEIMASEFRFLFALALLALLAGMTLLRRRHGFAEMPSGPRAARAVLVLLAAVAVAFVPWLATTGNGRYFLPVLLLVGPVCVGLAALLPATRAMRLALALGMVVLQGFAVQQAAPWRAWSLAAWKEAPYFHVDIPADLRAQPATYVTMSAISYSLLAPLFHPDSRWISVHNAPAPRSGTVDSARAQALLGRAEAGRLVLLVPAVAGMLTAERLPNDRVAKGIDQQLRPHRLQLATPPSCRFLPSRGLARIGLGEKTAQERAQSGFWLCQLVRSPASDDLPAGHRHATVFGALEALCPRFFPAGGDGEDVPLSNGAVRTYHRGDVKAYVYDSGEVFYKYYRSMNPVLVGKSDDLLAGRLQLDCAGVRGSAKQP